VASVTARCAGLRDGAAPEAAQCRPGWEHLPTDIRRLLAETWQAVLDGDSDGREMHERAHALADEHRTGRRVLPPPQYPVARYHAEMQAARDELDALRGAS
jgi:hypothetical protein